MPKPNVRQKILDAGLETIHRLGFNGCSVQDITQAAGVPKGSFYNHFESKEALGLEILEFYWQKAIVNLNVLGDKMLSPVERIQLHFDSLASNLSDVDCKKGCLFGNLGAELSEQNPKVRELLSSFFAQWTQAIELCIREAQLTNFVRADLDAAAIAAFLVNAWEGTVLRTKVNQDQTAIAQFKAIVFGVVLV